jgi:hypothetical protein
MSTSLYWRKIHPKKLLGYSLKFLISEEFWGHDGTLGSDWTEVSKENINIEYLKGLRDGSEDKEKIKEINKLLELLEKHGTIEISLQG